MTICVIAQLKPGYNAQIAVNSEYMVGVGMFAGRNGIGTLKPMLENMEQCLGKKFKNIVDDSGYKSEETYYEALNKSSMLWHDGKDNLYIYGLNIFLELL